MLVRQATKANHKKLRVVFFGGGSGTEAVLRALWHLAQAISAVIAVSDDGGDSGSLRDGLGWAPGDVRRALIALASNVTGQMARLFRVRLDSRFGDRAGQSFGNMVFAAAAQDGMDIAGQIDAAARLLGVTGKVYPATCETVSLIAEMTDGEIVRGESAIAAYPAHARRVRLEPETAAPPAGALEAIASADSIIVGPGSVMTSLIPAILPSLEAVAASRAARFLIVNAWREGENDASTASDYVRIIASHLPGRRLFDCVLVHQPAQGESPAANGRRSVEADLGAIRAMGYAAVGADLLGPDGRHSGVRVAALVAALTPKFSRQPPPIQPTTYDAVRNICPARSVLETRRTPCLSVKTLLCRVRRRRAATASVARPRSAPRVGRVLRRQRPS